MYGSLTVDAEARNIMRACIPHDDDEDEEATAADKAEVPDAQDGQE